MENTQIFTSNDFLAMLLRMFYDSGIHEIKEEELSKKLYSYYMNPKYEELFRDISKSQTAYQEVDIASAMKQEKYFGGGMWWALGQELLHLDYSHNNRSIKKYKKNLSQEGVGLMRSMVSDFATRYKVESISKCHMCIYGINPNKKYFLSHNSQLLTDGSIKMIKELEIELEFAKYAVVKKIENDQIEKLDVYTESTDLETLTKIGEIANKKYNEDDSCLLNDKPHVRKLVLK